MGADTAATELVGAGSSSTSIGGGAATSAGSSSAAGFFLAEQPHPMHWGRQLLLLLQHELGSEFGAVLLAVLVGALTIGAAVLTGVGHWLFCAHSRSSSSKTQQDKAQSQPKTAGPLALHREISDFFEWENDSDDELQDVLDDLHNCSFIEADCRQEGTATQTADVPDMNGGGGGSCDIGSCSGTVGSKAFSVDGDDDGGGGDDDDIAQILDYFVRRPAWRLDADSKKTSSAKSQDRAEPGQGADANADSEGVNKDENENADDDSLQLWRTIRGTLVQTALSRASRAGDHGDNPETAVKMIMTSVGSFFHPHKSGASAPLKKASGDASPSSAAHRHVFIRAWTRQKSHRRDRTHETKTALAVGLLLLGPCYKSPPLKFRSPAVVVGLRGRVLWDTFDAVATRSASQVLKIDAGRLCRFAAADDAPAAALVVMRGQCSRYSGEGENIAMNIQEVVGVDPSQYKKFLALLGNLEKTYAALHAK